MSSGTRQGATPSPSHSIVAVDAVRRVRRRRTARPPAMILAGSWSATSRKDSLTNASLGHDRLAAGALVAAADAVDLGGRTGAEPLQRACSRPRRAARATARRCRNSASSKRHPGEQLALVVGQLEDVVVEAGHLHPAVVVVQRRRPAGRSRWPGWAPRRRTSRSAGRGPGRGSCTVQPTSPRMPVTVLGTSGGDHAGVGDDHDVAVEPVAVLGRAAPRSSASRTPPRPRSGTSG